MTDSAPATLARQMLAAFDTGDQSVVDQIIHPDHREHAGIEKLPGRPGIRALLAWSRETFGDPHTTVEDVLVDGDRVAVRVTFSATQIGELGDLPATGRRFTTEQIHLWRVQDGQLAEHWMGRDDASMIRQLAPPEVHA